MVKAIIFDCFGVLTTDSWRAFVDSLPPDIDAQQARELNHQLDKGLITQEEFKQQIFELTGSEPQFIERMLDNEVFKNATLLDYIRELKGKGYKIGLLSNIASDWIRSTFLTEAEAELFDQMILSYEVGMTKPDPRIFMLACERLRVAPSETVLVDDVPIYCEAAQSQGLKAIVFEDTKQAIVELDVLTSDTNQ